MATVTNQTQFKNAIAARDAEIIVANDITLTSKTSINYAVTIRGGAGISLIWGNPTAASRAMLSVVTGGALTAESIIFDAQNRDGTLVLVNGGAFTMNAGAELRNLISTTGQSAVRVGDLANPIPGTFIMNGGLITGIRTAHTIFGVEATIEMHGDAAIEGNTAAGVAIVASSLKMTGRARISGNTATQSGAGCLIVESTLIMGENEGDAPQISDNSSPYSCGGVFLTNDSTLTMGFDAAISGNYATTFAGGLGAQDSQISLSGNAAIRDNRSGEEGCGMVLSKNTTTVIEGRAQIHGHAGSARGGGIYMQEGADLHLRGNASVHENGAEQGAGVFLNAATAVIGEDGSLARVYGNTASGEGGGIFVSAASELTLSGHATINSNGAAFGRGVYKRGMLNLSGSARIMDGLFYPGPSDEAATRLTAREQGARTDATDEAPVEFDLNAIVIIINPIRIAPTAEEGDFSIPTIVDALSGDAIIVVEPSEYISPENISLLLANKGADYAQLAEADRTAWQLPAGFPSSCSVILNDVQNEVWVVYQIYNITYENLRGSANPNPASYDTTDLPILLQDPEARSGYAFLGWYDASGQRVQEIPLGTSGDITLTAAWEKLFLQFKPNATCTSNMPAAINIEPGDTIALPASAPSRPCYCFTGWNTTPSGSGINYLPGSVITVPEDQGMSLYAQWQELSAEQMRCSCAREGCNCPLPNSCCGFRGC